MFVRSLCSMGLVGWKVLFDVIPEPGSPPSNCSWLLDRIDLLQAGLPPTQAAQSCSNRPGSGGRAWGRPAAQGVSAATTDGRVVTACPQPHTSCKYQAQPSPSSYDWPTAGQTNYATFQRSLSLTETGGVHSIGSERYHPGSWSVRIIHRGAKVHMPHSDKMHGYVLHGRPLLNATQGLLIIPDIMDRSGIQLNSFSFEETTEIYFRIKVWQIERTTYTDLPIRR